MDPVDSPVSPIQVGKEIIDDFLQIVLEDKSIGWAVGASLHLTSWVPADEKEVSHEITSLFVTIPKVFSQQEEIPRTLTEVLEPWAVASATSGEFDTDRFGSVIWPRLISCNCIGLAAVLSCCTHKLHCLIGSEVMKNLDGNGMVTTTKKCIVTLDSSDFPLVSSFLEVEVETTKRLGMITVECRVDILFSPDFSCSKVHVEALSVHGEKHHEGLLQHLTRCGFSHALISSPLLRGDQEEEEEEDDDDYFDDDLGSLNLPSTLGSRSERSLRQWSNGPIINSHSTEGADSLAKWERPKIKATNTSMDDSNIDKGSDSKGTWKFTSTSPNRQRQRPMLRDIGWNRELSDDLSPKSLTMGIRSEILPQKGLANSEKLPEQKSNDVKSMSFSGTGGVFASPREYPLFNGYALLAGELIKDEYDPVIFHSRPDGDSSEPIRGKLAITNYRILWVKDWWKDRHRDNPFLSFTCDYSFVQIPLTMLYRMDFKKKKKNHVITVSSTIFGCYLFQFDSSSSRSEFSSRVRELCPTSSFDCFAFRFCSNESIASFNGWNLTTAKREYSRFFVSDSEWRISEANVNFALCDTYPEYLCVPKSITDEELVQIAQFRSRGRLPVMTWRHPTNTASISRCAQPRVGLKGKRCDEDEKLLNLMLETNQRNNKQIYLLDARPRVNAIANTAMGAGVEDKKVYDMVKIKFLGIDNIHAMRKSYASLFNLCQSKSSSSGVAWLSSLESTKWLDYIRLILRSALRITRLIHIDATNVIIHCSDGWDRTPQLSSLSMIMMDPYYRTLFGFLCLLEMEWLSFGHKFCDRLGHMVGMKESEASPVFLQFIDCVFQIMTQFPTHFEFTQVLLMCIIYHASSSQYGTFLFNTPKERKDNKLPKTTISLWSSILAEKENFLNPLYKFKCGAKDNQKENSVILPKCSIRDLTFWKEFYLNDSYARESYFQTLLYMRQLKESTKKDDRPGSRQVVPSPTRIRATSRLSPARSRAFPQTQSFSPSFAQDSSPGPWGPDKGGEHAGTEFLTPPSPSSPILTEMTLKVTDSTEKELKRRSRSNPMFPPS